MKAMILAAGLGLRLRPLTKLLPKSMMPISNKPLLEYIIRYLKLSGINDIVINLHYLPKIIKSFFKDGNSLGIRINYSTEKEILGTAGGIKAAELFLKDGPFFVINSDIAFELDFDDVVQFHKKNNALITMVLREDKHVEKYGVIEIDQSCRVRTFLDFSNSPCHDTYLKTMFTGIALFDPGALKEFPDKGYCDISKEVYPGLLKKGLPLFGYVTDKYWMDMGTPQSYLSLQKEIFSGKVFEKTGCYKEKLNLQNSFNGVTIIPPVTIGENVLIDTGSVIGPYASIGNNCNIQKGCALNNSILWDNITIKENSKIENSIAYENKRILNV